MLTNGRINNADYVGVHEEMWGAWDFEWRFLSLIFQKL